jgi:adenosine deaminase
LKEEDIFTLAKNSFKASFLPAEDKEKFIKEIEGLRQEKKVHYA